MSREKREIRFRAWDSYSKEMLEWDDIYPGHKVTLSNLLNNLVEHITPLQFTGLKDKEGNPIYEGDVIQVYGHKRTGSVFDYEGNDYTITGVVIYQPSRGFCLKILNMHDTDNDEPMTHSRYGYITQCASIKIGNRFENPELLNTKTLSNGKEV